MAYGFIIKYCVWQFVGDNGERRNTLAKFDKKEDAIQWVKERYNENDRVAVFKVRYAGIDNYNKNFHYDYVLQWATYL